MRCSPTPTLAQRWEARKNRRVTDFFIFANVLIFALDFLWGSKLTVLGVKHNPSIVAGEWWRLLTCTFLHGGMLHIGVRHFYMARSSACLLGTVLLFLCCLGLDRSRFAGVLQLADPAHRGKPPVLTPIL